MPKTAITEVIAALKDGEEWESVKANKGIPEDILKEKANRARLEKYSLSTSVSLGRALLETFIKQHSGEEVTGIVCGAYDYYGSKAPVSYPLLTKEGGGTKLAVWDTKTLVSPGLVKIVGDYDEKFKNYLVKEVIAQKAIPDDVVVESLMKHAHPLYDKFWKTAGVGDAVVVSGKVGFVGSVAQWADNEKLDTVEPTSALNEAVVPQFVPILDISVKSDVDTLRHVTLQFRRTNRTAPIVQMDDFEELLMDAREDASFTTERQRCKFIADGIMGRSIIALGNIVSYSDREKDGETHEWYNVRVSAMFEVGEGVAKPSTETTLNSFGAKTQTTEELSSDIADRNAKDRAKAEKAKKAVPEPDEEDGGEEDFDDEEDYDADEEEEEVAVVTPKKSKPSTGGAATTNLIKQIAEDILAIADIVGKSPASMTETEIRETLNLGSDVASNMLNIAKTSAANKYNLSNTSAPKSDGSDKEQTVIEEAPKKKVSKKRKSGRKPASIHDVE